MSVPTKWIGPAACPQGCKWIGPTICPQPCDWAAKLQAVVDKWPKTDDGVAICLGDCVWAILDDNDVAEYFIANVRQDFDGTCEIQLGNEYARFEPAGDRLLFSTPEAAEAARKGKADD